MKKFSKVCLIICLVLVCVSIVCISAGAAMGSSINEVRRVADEGGFDFWGITPVRGFFVNSWDYDEYSAEDDEMIGGVVNETFLAEDINELSMDLYYGAITVEDSESENITISIDAPKRHNYSCKVSGGVLTLKETTKRWKRINWNYTKPKVVIGIPAGKKFSEVDINTSAGAVTIEHGLTGKDVSLEVDAGQMTAEKVTAGELELEAGAGELIVDDFSADDLSIDCGVGSIEIKGKAEKEVDATCGVGSIVLKLAGRQEDYDYELSCGVGSIEINGESFTALGGSKHIDNDAPGEISLDCGVGTIEVEIKE
ncbi:MAG: DUF4097 domain-containing protein [Roseburia sp.]|nr:DUF4097 domain-containing protein [Roseburia sp.]